ncbi:hypothetical protein H0H93_006828 [Arthromyces matolae]|nr:hypothetical protein H0H93_006828 [Arthromyces matolae]
MTNLPLFVVIASVLYAGNVSAGPIPRTDTPLPPDAMSTFTSASSFPVPEATLSSKIGPHHRPNEPQSYSPDISSTSNEFISSDTATLNLHDGRAFDSVERRDPISFALDVRSPTGHSAPQSPPPPQHASTYTGSPTVRRAENLLSQIKVLEEGYFGANAKVWSDEFDLTFHFLSSSGDQYAAQKGNPWVQHVVTTAKGITGEISKYADHECPTYLERSKIAAEKLLELYNRQSSVQNTTLSSDKVKLFEEELQSIDSKWHAERVTFADSLVKMMDLRTELFNLLTSRMQPYHPDSSNRFHVDFAIYLSTDGSMPKKVQDAAKKFVEAAKRLSNELHLGGN